MSRLLDQDTPEDAIRFERRHGIGGFGHIAALRMLTAFAFGPGEG